MNTCLDCSKPIRAESKRCRSCHARQTMTSPESRAKVGAAFRGRKLGPYSAERRAAIGAGRMGKATGPANGWWKGDQAKSKAGRNARRNEAIRLYPIPPGVACERCGGTAAHRHHKDRNPMNNTAVNIEFLCNSCHSKEHAPERSRARWGSA